MDPVSMVLNPSTQPASDQRDQPRSSRRSEYDSSNTAIKRREDYTHVESSVDVLNVAVSQAATVEGAEIGDRQSVEVTGFGSAIDSVPNESLLDNLCLPVARDESDRACSQLWSQAVEGVGLSEVLAASEAMVIDLDPLERDGLTITTEGTTTKTVPHLPLLTVAISQMDRTAADARSSADVTTMHPETVTDMVIEEIDFITRSSSSVSNPVGDLMVSTVAEKSACTEVSSMTPDAETMVQKETPAVSILTAPSIDRSSHIYKEHIVKKRPGSTVAVPSKKLENVAVVTTVDSASTGRKSVSPTQPSEKMTTTRNSSTKKIQTAPSTTDKVVRLTKGIATTKAAERHPSTVIDLSPAVEIDFDVSASNVMGGKAKVSSPQSQADRERDRGRKNPPARHRQTESTGGSSGGQKEAHTTSPNRFRIPLRTSAGGWRERRRSRSPLRPTIRRPVYMTAEEMKKFQQYKDRKEKSSGKTGSGTSC